MRGVSGNTSGKGKHVLLSDNDREEIEAMVRECVRQEMGKACPMAGCGMVVPQVQPSLQDLEEGALDRWFKLFLDPTESL